MQNSDSLKWERYILDLVYDVGAFDSFSHADRPDIRLTRGGTEFGVEITELFRDGSDARLTKIPDYMQRLWDGGSPIHKDDITGINVVTVDISDKDGNLKQSGVRAILRESVDFQTHYNALADHIERKNKAFAGYNAGLSHINLVVGDHFSNNESVGKEYSTAKLFTPRLRAAVQHSPFREIILISNVLYDDAAWIPLRELELFESFMLFVHAIFQTPEAPPLLAEEDVVHLFAYEMGLLGRDVEIRIEGGQEFAARANASVAYTPDGFAIHELADWPVSQGQVVPRRAVPLPDDVWSAIDDAYRKMSHDGAGVEISYLNPTNKAHWPFTSPGSSFISPPEDSGTQPETSETV